MKPAELLYQMRDLRDLWRQQSFHLTTEQQERYDSLMKLRQERVKFFYDNDLVSKGGLRKKEEPVEQEEN
jgi:hypothetical protein|tara:strand:- start:706 stop:915 length:210 start_codon:yes stop_codon:yes gene_type:complete